MVEFSFKLRKYMDIITYSDYLLSKFKDIRVKKHYFPVVFYRFVARFKLIGDGFYQESV
jgi:hypothetical protein